MYRLLLVIKFMEKGLLNKAYRVLYNYYGTTELYKGDYLKTLLLIDQYINGQIGLNDVKRSVNAFDGLNLSSNTATKVQWLVTLTTS